MKKVKLYVIGENTSQSLSPIIFSYWFSKYSINAEYDYKEISKKNFNKTIKDFLQEKDLRGFNITNPFKETIIPHLHEIDRHSKLIGAVNCVTIKDKKLYGSNTDWIGYTKTLQEKIDKIDRTNKNVILIGYGGAAKAILHALLNLGFSKIHIFNRSTNKLKKIKNIKIKTHNLLELTHFINTSNLIINTTPSNALKDLKINKALLSNTTISDIVYKPKETSFLKHFSNPHKKIYGISMLINQAILKNGLV